MHSEMFIHDLAMIMLVAGVVTLLFNRCKQPVVLGYLVAGIITGPHTPPFLLVHDQASISTLGQLGVVFLMFSLGLEFSLKKIAKVGASALVAACCETSFMLLLGYQLGQWLGWNKMDSLFLAAMIAISSTTIIVKALTELGLKKHKFAQLIFGILIVEDVLAIGIIALLSGLATNAEVNGNTVFTILGQLSLFIIITMTLGLLLIPRLVDYIASFRSNEMMLVSILGLCFGLCLTVLALNYSIALGAFMTGAMIAEARVLPQIEKLIEPLRDMFCAIFFVTIGMLFNPTVLGQYWSTILLIAAVLVIGKILGCSIGSFIAGESGQNSLRVGMGLAQIGEFSFIIAGMGASLKVTSASLYPIAIAVSAITTLSTPYLIRLADPLSHKISQLTPRRLIRLGQAYGQWVHGLHPTGESAIIVHIIAKIVAQIIVNWALVSGVFIAGAFVAAKLEHALSGWTRLLVSETVHLSITFTGALLISLPFVVAMYRKLKALSMMLAELVIKEERSGRYTYRLRRIVFESVPLLMIGLLLKLIFQISHSILPPPQLLLPICLAVSLVAISLRWQLIRFHSWLQIKLFAVMEDKAHDSN